MSGREFLALCLGLVPLAGGAADATSAWTLGVDQDITWETVHVLSQVSADTIPDEYGAKEVQPVLSFRCTEGGNGSISLQADWGRFISSFGTEAGFQVDDGKREWIKLGVDDSNRITSSRSPEDVDALLERLAAGDELSVEIVPYSESAIAVSFDLAGFAESIENLRSACR